MALVVREAQGQWVCPVVTAGLVAPVEPAASAPVLVVTAAMRAKAVWEETGRTEPTVAMEDPAEMVTSMPLAEREAREDPEAWAVPADRGAARAFPVWRVSADPRGRLEAMA